MAASRQGRFVQSQGYLSPPSVRQPPSNCFFDIDNSAVPIHQNPTGSGEIHVVTLYLSNISGTASIVTATVVGAVTGNAIGIWSVGVNALTQARTVPLSPGQSLSLVADAASRCKAGVTVQKFSMV